MSKHNYHLRKIKLNWEYTVEDISELFSVTTKTVYRWTTLGLKPIEGSQRPYLFHGEDLKEFIKNMLSKRRHPLGEDEFFCMKCRCPRKSKPGFQTTILTEIRMGTNKLSGRKTGVCEICGTKMFRMFTYSEESKQVN